MAVTLTASGARDHGAGRHIGGGKPTTIRTMKIGILGAGNIGAMLAQHFAQAGHEVAISNSRGPETLADLVAELGENARAVTGDEAARFGDLVVVAIPLKAYRDVPPDD